MYSSVIPSILYSQLYINFVGSKSNIVMKKIDFVLYYHLPKMVPFLIAGHIL